MVKSKYLQTHISIRISRDARTALNGLGASYQPIHAVIDDLIKNHKRILEENLEYQKTNIPTEIYDKLKTRKHPHQTIAGVIQELLDLAEKVEKAQMSIPVQEKKEN